MKKGISSTRKCSADQHSPVVRSGRITRGAADRGRGYRRCHKLSAGYRASKVIGSTVLNNADESIGKIDDILVSSDGKEPHAVISVGSFLGMGGRLIIVRYDSLTLVGSKVVPASGARDRLKVLSGFNCAVQ